MGLELMKNVFEKILWNSRYLTLLAVWSCIVGMALLFLLSALDMGKLLLEFFDVYVLGHDVPVSIPPWSAM